MALNTAITSSAKCIVILFILLKYYSDSSEWYIVGITAYCNDHTTYANLPADQQRHLVSSCWTSTGSVTARHSASAGTCCLGWQPSNLHRWLQQAQNQLTMQYNLPEKSTTLLMKRWQYVIVGFNVPLDTFGDDFTGQMTQRTVSQHWRTMVSQPGQGPIPPGSAH